MKIAVVTDDNSAMFTNEQYPNLFVVKMPFIIDDKEYFENESITKAEFFEKMKNDAKVSTSQPSPGQVLDLWDEVLKTYDQILHIPMSSELSASMQTARNLAQEYDGKVFVVDNKKISFSLRSSVLDALKLVDQNKSCEEIKDYLEAEQDFSPLYLSVPTLEYLRKGGRITAAAALLGKLLNIKPILKLSNGKIDAHTKTLSIKSAYAKMITCVKTELETTLKEFYENNQVVLGIAHANAFEEAEKMKASLEKAFPTLEVKFVDELSLSVACHTGPGIVGIGAIKCIK